jgi:release factor glutamine methyltransferase
MIEVAITSFNKVLKMDADPNEPECDFVIAKKLCDITKEVKQKLSSAKIDECDAEWIVSIATGFKRSELNSESFVSPRKVEKINEWVNERLTGRPLAYIVGNADFYGYKIIVNENVLIPRPETEELVELACRGIKADCRVLDLCTGSGAIAISVKKKTDAIVTASDISVNALEVARKNAAMNGVDICFVESNLFDNIEGEFDVIISNPPYIKTAEIDLLDREVKDYEPKLALDGGADGLDFYRRIAASAKEKLVDGGIVLMECGYDQAQDIKELFCEYSLVEIIKDINGIERIIKAVK